VEEYLPDESLEATLVREYKSGKSNYKLKIHIKMKTLKFFKHVCVMVMIVAGCFVSCNEKEYIINDMSYLSITSDLPVAR
jgi:hypothetical protein